MALENCQLCKGTGWKLVPRPDGAAGKVALACDCGMQDRAERVIERAHIPKRYEHCDFESYSTDLADGKTYSSQQADSLKRAKLFAQSFVRDYPASDQAGLLLMGNSGVGKTHLAIAALKELVRRGHTGYFCEYGSLLREIQQSYGTETEATEMRLLAPILSVEVLIIDDLGCIKPSDWVRDTIGYILNTRYIEGSRDLSHPRCTIITTNYLDSSEEKEARLPNGKLAVTRRETLADRISERTRSRLYEMCRTVEVSAPDFRREKTHAGRT
ncbi:MAG TPA: ATP-binding protein [Verrucomicrobiae bacterium]|jgi:DNA replication protein DnaC|nr:ATP-binding protein [Verrucomicrobiae bacterium]